MNAHGVVVAMPLGQSWAPTPSIGCVVNVGTVRYRPSFAQARRILRRIVKKRLEQFELEQLLAQLERRFFGHAATPASTAAPGRCFEVSVKRHGSWWAVAIPELDVHVSARRYEDVETLARAYISAVLDAPMSEIAVVILGDN